jgi:hypothetical protein
MSYPLRVESEDYGSFNTTRTRNSELWFVNNKPLEQKVLGYLAKNQVLFDATYYAFVIMGNHHHHLARFKPDTRWKFMRNFNSMTARLAQTYQPGCPSGPFWGRRYSAEFVPADGDIEKQFFYCALQPVANGLAERISGYRGYNSFQDAIYGVDRTFIVTDRAGYNRAKRLGRNPNLKDFQHPYTLKYRRLPGYEHLSQRQYATLMLKKLEEKRVQLVKQRRAAGLGFATDKQLVATKPGSLPRSTKKSTRESFRPLVLSQDSETRRYVLSWYFAIVSAYRSASQRFRAGHSSAEFPPGTFRPPVFCST